MKVPISWLKQYVKTGLSADEIGNKLTSIGHMQEGPIQEIEGDSVLDIEVRQNRSDVLSIVGVARELAAAENSQLFFPEVAGQLGQAQRQTKVIIEDEHFCYRFHAITIEDIELKPSPDWMRRHLEAYGIKSINNIIDITNFVEIELGLPLHAYDADKIADRTLIIRRAKKGEQLTLFGDRRVIFDESDIIHADSQGPTSFAGIMGGADKSVSNSTKSIILEAAVYNQASIRRSSIKHGIRTESSTRHEKFLDPRLVDVALARAVKLLIEFAGGKITDNTDSYPHPAQDKTITLPVAEIRRLGGVDIDAERVAEILSYLEIELVEKNDDFLVVKPPYFRTDLDCPADIVEELLRLYGYDKIESTLPSKPSPKNIQSPLFDFEQEIRNIMTAAGFNEQITEPLVHETESKLTPIKLENSLSTAKDMLRTTLKNNLVTAVSNWKKFGEHDIRLFEVGKIYFESEGHYVEKRTLGAIPTGKNVTYFDLKGVAEILFDRSQKKFDPSIFTIESVNDSTWYLELDLEALFALEPSGLSTVLTTPPQLIFHDFSFIVPTSQPVGEIINTLESADPLVYKVSLGEPPQPLAEDKKSVFLHVSFHNPEASISNKDIEPVRTKLVSLLENNFSATVRK